MIREGFQTSGDCRRLGAPVHALAAVRWRNTGIVGDIGVSVASPKQVGSQAGAGPFSVGGGVRVPEWFWPVLIVAAAAGGLWWLVRYFRRKKTS